MGHLAFIDTYPGAYFVQSILHSVLAAIIVEAALKAWNIRDPRIRQRFLLSVIVFPLISFPLYQAIRPERLTLSFRMAALFDSGRWIHFRLGSVGPVVAIGLILVCGLTSLVFLFQEFLPIVRHTIGSRNTRPGSLERGEEDPEAKRVIDRFPGDRPELFVLEHEEAALFSTMGRSGAVYISRGLLRALPPEQVQAAIAHEVAHVERGRRPFLPILFLLRALLFFNPVTLFEFRRIVQEDEKICDDYAVELTGRPTALAAALKNLYLAGEPGGGAGKGKTIMEEMEALESYSHRLHIENRIERLTSGVPSRGKGAWFPAVLSAVAIVLTTFYVV